MGAMLDAALAYAARGWTVLPMRMAEKRPAVRWRRYQRHPPSDSTLRRWFTRDEHGVAVVFGSASGGLASRDFDDMPSYERWAAAWPELARTLPTVATRRGRHVYCRLWPESVVEARRALGKPLEGRGAFAFEDGELRAGCGCYSVLPPSTHPSGHVYRWTVPLPEGDLPTLDACDCGFFEVPIDATLDDAVAIPVTEEDTSDKRACVGGEARRSEHDANECEADATADDFDADLDLAPGLTVEQAIEGSLPTNRGERRRKLFTLARRLKGIEALREADPRSLREVVQEWHRRALPVIGTKPFDETWIDFLQSWPNVLHPYRGLAVATAFAQACRVGLPDLAHEYDQAEVPLLAGLCRELQRGAGDGPFFLSCRTAAALLGVSHTQANRWLFLLCADGVLEVIEKGTHGSKRASRYRYLGPA